MGHLPILNHKILHELFVLNAKLGLYNFIKGIDYVRTVEFPVLAAEVLRQRSESLAFLDIGSGESIFPIFIASNSNYSVTVIDKFNWVERQYRYLSKIGKGSKYAKERFKVIKDDFIITTCLKNEYFDIITAVSVIEHMPNLEDSEALLKIYRLLKPGGKFIMTAPYNHLRYLDYYVNNSVYGTQPGVKGAFYQRHYDAESFKRRILNAAPFVVENIFFAGHYRRFNFAKWLYCLPFPFKSIKFFYNWATPFYAPHFLQLSTEPPADHKPQMLTADTVFAILKKPA